LTVLGFRPVKRALPRPAFFLSRHIAAPPKRKTALGRSLKDSIVFSPRL
jgi:hypothetical protein